MNKLIYAADDDDNIRMILESFLKDAGFDVRVFATGDELYSEFRKKNCDLAVLDIMMPGTDGITVCRQLRSISKVPIILLTARESEMDYIMGINSGGDDYLVKPFRPSILVMRIRALFRRMEMEHVPDSDEISFGDLCYSGKNHSIACRGADLGLTMTELALLRHMMKNADRAVSREELLEKIWGIYADVETRVTDETIRRIRKKLKMAGSTTAISVVWGYGYRLEAAK
jgi:DNA-binding response OmpR family regulator